MVLALEHILAILAIDKPAGMLVHPGRDPEPDDQIAMKAVRNYLGKYVYIVHRLDRPTSGVLLFTLSKKAQKNVSIQFQTWKVKKRYLAVTIGETEEKFSVDLPVKRNEDDEPAPSFTEFEKLNFIPKNDNCRHSFSLLSVNPHTGRHHQIRRHLAWNNLPIAGDYLYGDIDTNNEIAEITGIPRMMLMAQSLTVRHPVTGEDLTISAEPSEDFKFFGV